MSSNNRISEKSPAYQFLIELNFLLFFTKPNFNHIIEFLSASIQKGYKGTVADIVALSLSSCHRTTFCKFLSQGKWNPRFMWNAIKKYVISLMFKVSKNSDSPMFVIFDDTFTPCSKRRSLWTLRFMVYQRKSNQCSFQKWIQSHWSIEKKPNHIPAGYLNPNQKFCPTY